MQQQSLTPVFPLNTVLFPGGILPLQIFESRYLRMVSHCMRDNVGFVIVLIKEGKETGNAATHYEVGSHCKITDFDKRDNGLLGITVTATHSVRILNTQINDDGLILANTESLPVYPLENDIYDKKVATHLAALVTQLKNESGSPYIGLQVSDNDIKWCCQRLLEWLPFDVHIKYQCLEKNDTEYLVNTLLELTGLNS